MFYYPLLKDTTLCIDVVGFSSFREECIDVSLNHRNKLHKLKGCKFYLTEVYSVVKLLSVSTPAENIFVNFVQLEMQYCLKVTLGAQKTNSIAKQQNSMYSMSKFCM